jgi:hydrogenase large subunit
MGELSGFLIPAGAILGRDLTTIHEVDLQAAGEIQEYIAHSWYNYDAGKTTGLHPYAGETKLNYDGPQPPYKHLDIEHSYSWLKSPRWKGHAMEVGPLARMLIMYAKGHKQVKELVDTALSQLDIPITALFSTLGRTAARGLETQLIAAHMQNWYDSLVTNIKSGDTSTFNDTMWDPATWPRQAQGVGFMEAPRGALAHWIVIENGTIKNYQAVVPSTWNAGPRDHKGQPGAYEAALEDNHILHDPEQPLEILRTIHSFDPCIACAVHVMDPNGTERVQIRIR